MPVKSRKPSKPPAFMRMGASVFYTPVLLGDPYPGTIVTDPWQLGDGRWVCHVEMGDEYRRKFGRSRVFEATADALRETP